MKPDLMASTMCLCLLLGVLGSRLAPLSRRGAACDAGDLTEVVGYTAITSMNVVGDFEGADFDKPVKLDNGMIFEFTEYNYNYSYRPEVIVFARAATLQGRSVTLYKLLIDEELYDAIRVR